MMWAFARKTIDCLDHIIEQLLAHILLYTRDFIVVTVVNRANAVMCDRQSVQKT